MVSAYALSGLLLLAIMLATCQPTLAQQQADAPCFLLVEAGNQTMKIEPYGPP